MQRSIVDFPRSEAGLVDNFLGTSYDVVKAVYIALPVLTDLHTLIPSILQSVQDTLDAAMIPVRVEINGYIATSRNWAISTTNPDPLDLNSKSSRTWALEALASANAAAVSQGAAAQSAVDAVNALSSKQNINANLTAFSALVGTANVIPVFTGPNTFTLLGFNAANAIAKLNASGVLAKAQGGTGSATPDSDFVTEGATNKFFTTARVLATAAAGLSLASNAVISAADTILTALGKLQVQVTDRAMKGNNSDITQLTGLTTALSVGQGGTGRTSIASFLADLVTGGAYSKTSILGTVSQSGGVPTGAIIERGSNANGSYIKYADGSMTIFKAIPSTSYTVTTAAGSAFKTSVAISPGAYPVSMTGINSWDATIIGEDGTCTAGWVTSSNTGTWGTFNINAPVSGSKALVILLRADGVWFN